MVVWGCGNIVVMGKIILLTYFESENMIGMAEGGC